MKRVTLGILVLSFLPATALAQALPPLPSAAPAPAPSVAPAPPAPAPPATAAASAPSASPVADVPYEPLPIAGTIVRPIAAPVTAPAEEPVGPPKKPLLRFAMGPRIAYVRTSGFDAYSKNDVLAQWSLEGTATLLEGRKTSLAVGLAYDVGGRRATTRTVEMSLAVHRLSVPIEGRYHVAPWLYAFGRVAPGAALGLVRAKDSGAPTDLTDTVGFASADLSAGASFLFGPHNKPDRRLVRIWATPELGYGITTRPGVHPSPTGRDEKDVLGTDAPGNLGALAVSGFFWRLSLAATF